MLRVKSGFEGANQATLLLIHYGPEITVNVGFDEKWRTTSSAPPSLGASSLKALVDTGARESCIDCELAQRLRLPHVDRRLVRSVTGPMEVDYFRAHVHVPLLKFTMSGQFAALPLASSGFQFQALLGRSFLQYVQLVYDGPKGAYEFVLP
jgi:hypothetical protein